jgi:hypothetical protein
MPATVSISQLHQATQPQLEPASCRALQSSGSDLLLTTVLTQVIYLQRQHEVAAAAWLRCVIVMVNFLLTFVVFAFAWLRRAGQDIGSLRSWSEVRDQSRSINHLSCQDVFNLSRPSQLFFFSLFFFPISFKLFLARGNHLVIFRSFAPVASELNHPPEQIQAKEILRFPHYTRTASVEFNPPNQDQDQDNLPSSPSRAN